MSKEFKQMITEEGTAVYPKVNKTVDVYDGKEVGYTIQLKFADKKKTENLIKQIDQEFERGKKADEFNGKTWMKEPNVPYRVDEKTGDTLFKFSTKHLDKEGNRKTIPIVDSNENIIDVNLGHGSIVRVAFSPSVYHLSSKNNGIKLYLNAIQVIKLEEFGGSGGRSFGFGKVSNGYVANETYAMPEYDDDSCPI